MLKGSKPELGVDAGEKQSNRYVGPSTAQHVW